MNPCNAITRAKHSQLRLAARGLSHRFRAIARMSAPAGPGDHYEYVEAPLLARVRSRGYVAAAGAYGTAAAIGMGQAAQLLLSFLSNPASFLYCKDRSAMDSQEPLPGLQHEYLEANGIRIHAVSLGRQPTKPLMLFCHGFPEFWYSWRHQLQHYSKDYDAVAIDMRGYGRSDKPPGVSSYRMDVIAADVAAVIKALGHERCVLVAADWGGIIAWVVAGMYPHMVDRLVVLAGPHMGLAAKNSTPAQQKKSWYVLVFQLPWLPETFLLNNDVKSIQQMYTSGTMWGPRREGTFTDQDREWYKWAFTRPGAATATINWYRALMQHLTYAPIPEVWRALKRQLPMPVLAVMGGDDSAIEPSIMNRLDQVAPVSEVHVLEGCSHWVACEQPDKVIQLMTAFLAEHPPLKPSSKL